MTRIILIRHAEAEGNLYRRAHGHYDSRLTKNGLAQAERLGEWFALRPPVDAIYSSDLRRAVRTAEAIASVSRRQITENPALREINLGEWEDMPWGEIARHWDTHAWFENSVDWNPKGAERVDVGGLRLHNALSSIAAAHIGEVAAVVSHGCVIRDFLEKITNKRQSHLDNASISLVKWENEAFEAEFIGDNRHLSELSTLSKQSWWRSPAARSMKDPELWFLPVEGGTSAALERCRHAWKMVYGTNEGFCDESTLKTLVESAEAAPRYLQFVMSGEKQIGLIHLRDTGRMSITDCHISLLVLDLEHQGFELGAQLLGEAISTARSFGKTGLSLRVFHQNTKALSFYSKMGFLPCGSEDGIFGKLIQMRLSI